MIAYKLVRKLKDGSISPLFINKRLRIPVGEWLEAEDHKTKGFAHRVGWHCTRHSVAPHLKTRLKSGEVRVWYMVEIEDFTEEHRPLSQGGLWYLANKIKFLEEIYN